MPNVSYQLTLTSEQLNSGPYYVVTYTTASAFIPVLAGSPAFLPNVGSTAVVQIPEAASSASYLAFNLNNNGDGGVCTYCDNDVILVITGSAPFVECCTGSILSVVETGSVLRITYNSGTGANCLPCNYVTVQTSSDGFGWGGNKTGSCGVSQSIDLTLPTASCPANTTYYRLFQTCEGTPTPPPTPTTTTTSTTTTTTTPTPTTTTTSTTTTTTTPTPTPTTTTTTTTTTTSTTTSTTTLPPSESCVKIEYVSRTEAYLDCGVNNLYRDYTASFFTNCTASNAPEDIFVYFTASGGSPVTTSIYTLIINSGSHQGFENVYTRIWEGDCLNKVSTDYTVDGYNIVPAYATCSCDTPPPTTTSTTTTTTTPTPTTTTTTTTTSTTTTTTTIPADCACYLFFNETGTGGDISYKLCGGDSTVEQLGAGQTVRYCIDTSQTPTGDPGITIVPCSSVTTCTTSSECTSCT